MAAAAELELEDDLEPPREEVRTRKRPQPIDLGEAGRLGIAKRVVDFYKMDDAARGHEKWLRKQRYAKLMQYEAPMSTVEGASNVQLSDIAAACFRFEDQIQNAVVSTRPIMNAHALAEVNKERERKVDLMLDYQFFVEQDGEDLIEWLTANFFRDGQYSALTHWVREQRKVMWTRSFARIPAGTAPRQHFMRLLEQAFGKSTRYREVPESEGWDYDVFESKDQKKRYRARFFTEDDGEVTMEVSGDVVTYEGPYTAAYGWEDVLAPAWAKNLQPPGPSNPAGAPHVIMVDYPTKDEVLRCIESGFYDLVEPDEIAMLDGFRDWSTGDRELAAQRHILRGQGPSSTAHGTEDKSHNQLRRLLCFDTYNGLDVVWWVLEGPDILLRARPLTEVCPGLRPERPISHTVCIKVQDTWVGMGIPELMESTHDYQVVVHNLMVDAAILELAPFFKYRITSNLKNETILLAPGKGIPCQNPATDLIFERMQAQSVAIGSNMIAMSRSDQERLLTQGDLQAGQIPRGASAALRTSSGIQQVLAQGEARPERMLRRFFKGLRHIYATMYRLDRHYLPTEKKFRAAGGVVRPDEDPIVAINRTQDLGDVNFEFQANVLNSSKVALQQALQEMFTIMSNPLMLQTGISTPDSLFRLLGDYFSSLGQTAEKYLNQPSPMASMPPITGADALNQITAGKIPQGPPAEGSIEAHAQAIFTLLQTPDDKGMPFQMHLSTDERERTALYLQMLKQRQMQAQQQMMMLQAAEAGQANAQQQPAGGGPPQQDQPPMVSGPAEAIDETMPGAGRAG